MFNRKLRLRGRRATFESLEPRHVLATFFVATDGNDLQSTGDINNPFASINRANVFAQPGDTIFLREGVYRTTALTDFGTAGNPITYAAYNGENVVFSGADLVTGWTQVSGMTDVWMANVNWNANNNRAANTLFVNGELKLEAREHAEFDPMNIDDWGLIPQGAINTTSFTASDLAGWGNDFWNGAKVKHHRNDFLTVDSVIADYNSATGTVTFETPLGGITQKQAFGYYIFDTIKALDQPGEWYKGKAEDGPGEQNKLYYKAEPGQNPNSLEIEFKRRAYGLDVRAKDYVHIEGITFRGASIQTDGNTDRNVYKGNTFYGYDKGSFGQLNITGDNNIFRDNEVSQIWNRVANVGGVGNQFINNYMHEIGYEPISKVITMTSAEELLFSHNTVSTFAEAFADGYPVRSEFAYNVFEDGGNLSWDTGVFDADGTNGDQSFSIFHHNVFRNTDTRGIYEAFYGRNSNAVIHHNLFYDFDGNGRTVLRSYGLDFRQAFHNTVITSSSGAPSGNLDARGAIQTRYNNNVQIHLDRMEALGVDVRGNYNYSTSDFVNFGGDDFRLAAGSGAIEAGIVIPGINDDFLGNAPDAGAFEFDPNNPNAPGWTAGHDFASPPNPIYAWQELPGSNRYFNGQFGDGIGDWTIESGSPNSADRVSWNLSASGASLTGTFRTQSVEFTPGESMSRTFTGLTPSTTYTLGVGARVATRLVDADQFGGSNGTITADEHRDEEYVTGLTAGEWVRYDNIDFGDPGQYNQLDLLHIRDPDSFPAKLPLSGITVQVRVDSAGGPVIAEFSDLVDGNTIDRWRADRTDLIGNLSGSRSIYVSLTGANSANLALGSFRLINSSPSTSDLLSVSVESPGTNSVSAKVGSEDWEDGYEEITFTTGSAATTAEVSFANNGRLDAYLDRIYLIEGRETRGSLPRDISSGMPAERSLTASTSTSAPGVTDGILSNETVTGNHAGSWIQVDLGEAQPIYSITLSPSASSPTKLSNFRLSVWSSDPRSGGTELWSQDYLGDGESFTSDLSLLVQGDARSLDGETRLASVKGRFVRVELLGINNSGDNQLALGEIQVLSLNESNLTVTDGIATQSTTQAGGAAGKASDGDPNTSSATQTSDTNSWWQVRFAQAFSIGQIELVNQEGAEFAELSNFTVSVWDEDPAAGGSKLWENSYFSTGSVGQGGTLTIDGSEIDPGTTRRLASNHTGRVVRVQLNGTNNAGNGRLSLAEVRVAMTDTAPPATNLAQDGIADQRNDFYGDRGAGGTGFGFAEGANDGVIIPIVNFTSALNEPNGWWQVDLLEPTPIDQIVLYNRVDAANRLDDFWVEVWDGDPDAGGSMLWDRFYQYSSFAPTYSTGTSIGAGGALIIDGSDTDNGLRLDQVVGGEYVRVQMTDSDILSLAEVQVWAPDSLVRIAPDATTAEFDLGTINSSVSGGAERISPYVHGDADWVGDVQSVDRGGNGPLDDFISAAGPATLGLALPNGVWQVSVTMGDSQSSRDDMRLWANGALIADNIDTSVGQAATQVFQVTVNDGRLNLSFDDAGGSTAEWAVNHVSLARADDTLLQVLIDPATGETVVQNNSSSPITFDGYSLADTAPSLLVDDWFSLQDQAYDGGIWFEANPTAMLLTEVTNASETILAPGELLYLGRTVDPTLVNSLSFEYYLSSTEEQLPGVVSFVDPGTPALAGDYNGDLIVNAADYTVWRDRLGDSTTSFQSADGNGNGVVDRADYLLWKKNFGNSAVATTTSLISTYETVTNAEDASASTEVEASIGKSSVANDNAAQSATFSTSFTGSLSAVANSRVGKSQINLGEQGQAFDERAELLELALSVLGWESEADFEQRLIEQLNLHEGDGIESLDASFAEFETPAWED